jgi:hypothetical protein
LTRAGIVQAFILAFYAEMYGFPVTIYLLARIFNLDVVGSFWDGNLWVYLTGAAEAMLVSMAIGYTIAFSIRVPNGPRTTCQYRPGVRVFPAEV